MWTTYSKDYNNFYKDYKKDMHEYGSINRMIAKPNPPSNTFPVSMIPWSRFDAFNLNIQKGYEYLFPIFTLGKFDVINGRCLLPLAVQVHHAVCDGFHISRFFNELQKLIEQFSTN